jgi:arginine/lysine/ornithine decarboxylase
MRYFDSTVVTSLEPFDAGCDISQSLPLAFFASPAQQLHSQAYAENILSADVSRRIQLLDPALLLQKHHSMIKSSHARQYDVVKIGKTLWLVNKFARTANMVDHPFD